MVLPTCAGLVALLAAAALGPGTPPGQVRLSLDDPTIVAIFDAANTYDVETSDLAAKQAIHPDVRQLGTQFAHDHTALRQQDRDLAKKLGVTPTPPKDDKGARDHAEVMSKLKTAKGAAFDQAYLANEVAYHQAVIDAINHTLLPAIQNAELKAFVQKVVDKYGAEAKNPS